MLWFEHNATVTGPFGFVLLSQEENRLLCYHDLMMTDWHEVVIEPSNHIELVLSL